MTRRHAASGAAARRSTRRGMAGLGVIGAGAILLVGILTVAVLDVRTTARRSGSPARSVSWTGSPAAAAAAPAEVLDDASAAARTGVAVGAGTREDRLVFLVDTARSVVRWRGTKFRGRGKHEGVVPIREGELLVCGLPDRATTAARRASSSDTSATRPGGAARACGGRVVVDVQRLAVTDIPAHEGVARRRLTEHLLGPDFLWTARYPAATFTLAQAEAESPTAVGAPPRAPQRPQRVIAVRVVGDLTIRGVTRRVALPATLEQPDVTVLPRGPWGGGLRARARFRIDRQRWGVAYRWDPVRNELVDDDVTLDVELVAAPERPVRAP